MIKKLKRSEKQAKRPSRAKAFFAERRNRADSAAFDKLMRRKGGEKPREGDEPG